MNGANFPDKYRPTVTSYDYGTMLTEWGDRNRTYYEVRDILVNEFGDKVPPISVEDAKKRAYGRVELTEAAPLFDNLDRISRPVHSAAPKYMEDLGQSYGYILYSTTVKGPANDWALAFDKLHDRALVYVDGVLRATYMRSEECAEPLKLPMAVGEEHRLDVLVENMGRVNYGPKLLDRKGAVGIRFGNQYHFGWDIYPLPMTELDRLNFEPRKGEVKTPTFLRGYLDIEDEPCDTFIRTDGFTKGFVTVNGFNLGRYWRVGPTKTLYVPAPMLKKGRNEIMVFESDGATDCAVVFTDTPDIG
jgi:beta-galactosidase